MSKIPENVFGKDFQIVFFSSKILFEHLRTYLPTIVCRKSFDENTCSFVNCIGNCIVSKCEKYIVMLVVVVFESHVWTEELFLVLLHFLNCFFENFHFSSKALKFIKSLQYFRRSDKKWQVAINDCNKVTILSVLKKIETWEWIKFRICSTFCSAHRWWPFNGDHELNHKFGAQAFSKKKHLIRPVYSRWNLSRDHLSIWFSSFEVSIKT